uniref:Uncharacterized protein n=1 Tax=Rhizophagus irregularis (strain DAOM 181602 / DAOM 197198 / MUCL 43194) TaxID=747089 RepID=U9TJ22_RHIID
MDYAKHQFLIMRIFKWFKKEKIVDFVKDEFTLDGYDSDIHAINAFYTCFVDYEHSGSFKLEPIGYDNKTDINYFGSTIDGEAMPEQLIAAGIDPSFTRVVEALDAAPDKDPAIGRAFRTYPIAMLSIGYIAVGEIGLANITNTQPLNAGRQAIRKIHKITRKTISLKARLIRTFVLGFILILGFVAVISYVMNSLKSAGLLLVPLFASAANESICDVHKDGFTKEEKLACGIEMAKNSKILLSVSDATDKKVTEIGAAFLGSQFDINVSDTSELQNSESAFTALLGGQHYVSQKIIGWLFVAVGAIGYLFLLWAGAIKGLLVFLAATMGTVFFFPIISLIGDISSDVKSEQTNFSMDARAFADTATTYLIQSNMQDLVARKSLLVETGYVNKSGITNKYEIGEEKFQTCLENTIAPAQAL